MLPLRAFAIAVLAAIAAGMVVCTSAPAAPAAAVEFVFPAAGAFIASGPVAVAGRVPEGAGAVSLLLDGAPVADVSREGRTFAETLAPAAGPHTLEVRAGELGARLVFTFGSGGRGEPPYRYHQPVLDGGCVQCHAGVRRGTASAEAETCKGCHRKLAVFYPYVHAPLADGQCVVCHDPHGSSLPSLMAADALTMCTSCHDKPASHDDPEKGRSRVCHFCHNPHASMNRRLLYDIVK